MRRHPFRSTARPATLAALLLVSSLVAGCTSDGGEEAPPEAEPSSSVTAGSDTEEPLALATKAKNGNVTGKIGKGDRKDVVDRVAAVVDEWLAAAYVDGDYPREASAFDDSAWPGFTRGAALTAAADKDLMSNADIADRIDGLVVKRREITVDLLAIDRTARAATARVRLAFKTDGVEGADDEGFERKVTVTGRVFLTKKDGTWKVFGYDVAKGRA